ncbi:MAG: extracellular solute-binding protein [Velocimicrobium sp.]
MKKGIVIGLLSMGIIVGVIGFFYVIGKRDVTNNEMQHAEKKELVLWSYYETTAQQESLDLLVQNFNLSQSEYMASWEYVPMTEFTKRLSIGIMENDLPDMVIIDNPDMKTYAELGIFADLTEYKELWKEQDQYYPEVWKSVEWNGRYYGLPFTCNNVALIYNKEMLEAEKITPPTTWDELEEAAKKLKKGNCYGFIMSCVEGEQSAFQVLPWILSAGETMNELGGDHTQEAFAYLQTLSENEYLDANCVNWSQNDIARKFVRKEAAMMENGPWVLPMLQEKGISYGIVPLPMKEKRVVIAGGENIGVIKDKDVDGAVSFLTYYSSGAVMKEICQKSSVLPPKMEEAKETAMEDKNFQCFEEQMHTSKSRADFDGWTDISDELSEAIHAIITGEMNPMQAAEHLK